MSKTCKMCEQEFFIFAKDKELLEKYSFEINNNLIQIPEPSFCPNCRAQRRLAWRNERNYFKSKSSLSNKPIISVFESNSKYKQFSYDEWWSNEYDPLKYARHFDFNRSFFDQFNELITAVPHMAMIGSQNENSAYCHLIANCKNCYLLVESSNCEDCYYSYWLQKCLNCIDSSFSHECSYCYEIDNCYNCYNLFYSKDCNNCSDSFFSSNCIGCKNCFGCINLVQKEYYIFNKKSTKEEYESFIKRFNLGSRTEIAQLKQKVANFYSSFPKRFAQIIKSENCVGNYILSSKNCFVACHAHDAEECRYAEHVWRNSKYNMDVSTVGRDAEFVYESLNCGVSVYKILFSIQCWNSSNMTYCYSCMNSKNSFGSVGLKNNNFCIFNKQYSEYEYNKLVLKIIAHMKKTGEWGEFFPAKNSIFPYNLSSAQEQFSLERAVAEKNNYSWYQNDPKDYKQQNIKLEDDIIKVQEEILSSVLSCESCKKNYKIISQELEFYKKHKLPVPSICADCRHSNRLKNKKNAKMYDRKCNKCSVDILSSYDSISDIIYCEKCFTESLT